MTIATIHVGDCREILRSLPEESVHCVVTSPPYWGLRSYLYADDPAKGLEIGSEATLAEWVETMVGVFREVRRVLRKDGTLWVNCGDAYAAGGNGGGAIGSKQQTNVGSLIGPKKAPRGLKPKDLCGQPWRLAFGLQADGWWLRSDVVWAKPNPMPESVTDRPTRAHEYLFLLTRSPRYFYDAEAIRESLTGPAADNTPEDHARAFSRRREACPDGSRQGPVESWPKGWATHDWAHPARGKNRRSVWTIPPAPFSEAHFATFPPALVEPCILAGTSERGCCATCGAPWRREVRVAYERSHRHGEESIVGRHADRAGCEPRRDQGLPRLNRLTSTTGWNPSCACPAAPPTPCAVLDPFSGAGTTGLVALRLGRDYVGVELKREYVEMSQRRIVADQPLLNTVLLEPRP